MQDGGVQNGIEACRRGGVLQGVSGDTSAAHYFCCEYTQSVLTITPSKNGTQGEQMLWPQNLYKHPLLPTTIAQSRA